ncbi:MAG: S-layer homology domain-containing protein [Ruminococcus sp.]|jgi:opacity protein-like surface antigen|nr:S-layer homology domain-containing protein [Ruminococcus sp.]
MKKLKLTAVLMALALSAGVISVSADEYVEEDVADDYYVYAGGYYGGNSTSSEVSDVDLQTALAKVKRRIDVPARLSEFEYRVNTKGKTTTFHFTWRPKDSAATIEPLKVGSVIPTYLTATIVGDVITNVDYNENKVYGGDGSTPRAFGKINPEDYEAAAKRAVNLVNPGMADKVEFTNMTSSLYGESVWCSFNRVENGIRVATNSGSVSFDKDSGKLLSFNVSWWDNAEFPDPAKRLSATKIQSNYESVIKLNPAYIIKKDYQKGVITAEIVYTPSADGYEFDAFTGKETTMYEDMKKFNSSVDVSMPYYSAANGIEVAEAATGMSADDEAVAFTAAERREIEESKVRYTKEQAAKVVEDDPYIFMNDKYKLTAANLYSNSTFGPEKNTWQLQFKLDDDKKYGFVSVVLDADTGKIEQFSQSGANSDTVVMVDYPLVEDAIAIEEVDENDQPINKLPLFDVAKNNTKATDAAKYYYGNSFNEYRAVSANTKPLDKDSKTGKTINIHSRTFRFERYHENIPVKGDSINVTVNGYGEVTNISQTYTKATFPKAEILTAKEAFAELWKQTGFSLYFAGFTADGTPHTYLIYGLPSYYMNARTGKLSDYYGDPIPKTESTAKYEYSDIKDDDFGKKVTEMGYYGIQLKPIDGKFSAQSEITGKELYTLFRSYTGGYYNSDEIFGLDKSEKAITYREAAKLFTTMSGSAQAAKLTGIYASVYTDIPAADPDVGYINIAKALGLQFLDGNKFMPDNKVTRAEAINILYGFLDPK